MTWMLLPLALAAAFAAGVLRGCLTRRRDIWTVCGDAVYLQRWFLLGGSSSEESDNPRPMSPFLHRILLPDPDREPHDHPWSFLTLVLWGGYVEEVHRHNPDNLLCSSRSWSCSDRPLELRCDYEGLGGFMGHVCRRKACDCPTVMHWCRPGTIHWRPAEYTHRIDSLPRGWALTLVLRLRRRRKWGFHTLAGWVPWRRHLADRRAAICED